MPALAFSYVRFSSDKQAEGESLSRQVRAASGYALNHNLLLDTSTYRDLGVSAFKSANLVEGALGTFVQAVDAGKIPKGSFLLVESLDRLSRDNVDTALELFLSITRRDITIVTLMDGQVYSKKTIRDNWTKLIMALAIMSRANEESVTKSKRVKDAYDKKRERGEILTSKGPSWLVLDKDKMKWKIIPAKAKVIGQIFDWAIAGYGQRAIVNMLEEKKIPTMVSAKYWTQSTVAAILRNSSVYGRFEQKSGGHQVIDNPDNPYYPPIMSKEKFMTAQSAVQGRKSKGSIRKKVPNIFSGLSFCAHCGERMKYQPTQDNYAYLRCMAAYTRKENCPSGLALPYSACETAFIQTMASRAGLDISGDFFEEQQLQAPALQGEIDTLKMKQGNLVKLAAISPDVEAVGLELSSVQRQIDELTHKLKSLTPPLTKDEIDEHAFIFKKYMRLKGENRDDELNEYRRQMKVAIARLFKKVELGFSHKNEPTIYVTLADDTRALVNVGPFLNNRSKAGRAAKNKETRSRH